MSYDEDRKWSDRFLPQVCDIVGPRLLVPAPLRQDRLEATDLIVLRARDMTIGVRLRRPGYSSRYPGEFTLRARRATGVPTELTKIVEGWGDWLFYGHTDTDGGIPVWMLLDLNKLRTAFMLHPFCCGTKVIPSLASVAMATAPLSGTFMPLPSART